MKDRSKFYVLCSMFKILFLLFTIHCSLFTGITEASTNGIDVRQGSVLILRASLKDSLQAIVTTGTTTLKIYEIQSDGTFKSYDFADNTFKTTALSTETVNLTHRTGNNGGTNTGVWTYALSTLTGFTAGNVYIAIITNSGASPTQQEREFQYKGNQEDISTLAVDSTVAKDGTVAKAAGTKGTDAIYDKAAAIPTNPMQTGEKVVLAASQTDYAPSKAGDAMDLVSGQSTKLDNIKTVTDKFLFDGSNFVKSVEQVKTGYSLTQTFPTHFADLAITETTGKVTVGTNSDKTGYSLDSAYDAAKTAATQSSVDTIDGIVDSILTESQSHPTLAEIEATTVLAKEGNVETHVTTSLNAYDPPTRTEATSDKDAVIVEVNANETKIDNIDTSTESAARFIEIKGSGWTDESLKAIKDAVDAGATPAEIWAYATRELTSRNIATGEDIAREQTLTGNLSSGVLQNMITVTDNTPQEIKRGDIKDFTFNLGAQWNLTWKKVYFIAKAVKDASNSTAIFNRTCTITDPVNGVATIRLTKDETAIVGNYFTEIEIRNTDESDPQTAREFMLKIKQDIRQ